MTVIAYPAKKTLEGNQTNHLRNLTRDARAAQGSFVIIANNPIFELTFSGLTLT
jgi:hypothetical protein